ncbi:MAG: AAA family ATPase, partial [Chloroflexota bacterium]
GDLALGASPRGTLALYRASQALAAVRGRDHVLPDDVKELAQPVLAHRCLLRPDSALRGQTVQQIIAGILESTPLDLQ